MAETDLISRQAAINAASEGCFEWRGVFARIEEKLKALPSAQPEIIHCKECKHHISYKVIPSDWCMVECDAFDSSMARQIKPDFFCGYAERREDDE